MLVPEDDSPTAQVADRAFRAEYDDLDRVREFAESVSVVTFEFENVLTETANAAAEYAPVRPAGSLLHTTQQRRREKEALTAAGVPVARFATIESDADLTSGIEAVGTPAILKTAAFGYDGKGQIRIPGPDAAGGAWGDLDRVPCVLEAVVPFEREISVVGVRGLDGEIALYDPIENHHVNHILDTSVTPAAISDVTRRRAVDATRTLLEAWDVVGVICVEMFVLPDGEVIVNEVAPRPHNSGHLTIDAHACSQFEQQVRAVCGLPLGETTARSPAAMANLLGDVWRDGEPAWERALDDSGFALHLYGKAHARPGRKMGHLTVLAESPEAAREAVVWARARLLR